MIDAASVASAVLLSNNASTVLRILNQEQRRLFSLQDVYRRVRQQYYGDINVSMRSVERALDQLIVVGCIEKTIWKVVDSDEEVAAYGVKPTFSN